jgi:hypothetical protein
MIVLFGTSQPFFDSTYDWSAHLKDASEVEPRLVDTDEEDVEE